MSPDQVVSTTALAPASTTQRARYSVALSGRELALIIQSLRTTATIASAATKELRAHRPIAVNALHLCESQMNATAALLLRLKKGMDKGAELD